MNSEIDFNYLLHEFSNHISEQIFLVSEEEANIRILGDNYQIWKIDTGLYDEDSSAWVIEEYVCYIVFPKDFPYKLPGIYIDLDNLSKFGHIPHLMYSSGNVCVYDEFVSIDDSNPTEIIHQVYTKAKQTLLQGLKKENTKDFQNEYKAYWESIESQSDKILIKEPLVLIDNEPTNWFDLKMISFCQNDRVTDIIFNEKEKLINPYISYLKKYNIEFETLGCFYIGSTDYLQQPPFEMSFDESLKLIPDNLSKDFKKFYNSQNEIRIIFQKEIEKSKIYFGWQSPNIDIKKKGFRKNSFKRFDFAFNKVFGNYRKSVIRFSTKMLNQSKLIDRTRTQNINLSQFKFLVAGIGSVGSFLTLQLNTLEPDFTLIDRDELSVDNIKRHVFGFDKVGLNKSKVMQQHLLSKNPVQNVEAIESSVSVEFRQNKGLLNNQDYNFLCIGNQNLEKWFITEMSKGTLTKPLFVLWVEPYLIGAQCLFLHPNNPIEINQLFYDIYKFRYSVIKPEEFENKRDLFILKESGCQTTFSPYSGHHLNLFINSIYEKIFEIIHSDKKISKILTWVGDLEIAKKLDIKVSEIAEEKGSFSILEEKL